ncbi:PQQ-binding-like beta-propeller repeat protein [Lignipirellula cremea]|uniref:PQQ-binding-like beta-propeller repeat protein n=1 Tax=Lignipirellula cremea TaxID=2528010 RepID=UPI0018D264BE|nr:PQQ-binding-like beta-propeller repeat protein [Lignipirellula cremea]
MRRPSMPLKCEACGQARVGLFKPAAAGTTPAPGAPPAAPARPAAPQGGPPIAPPPPLPGMPAPPPPAAPIRPAVETPTPVVSQPPATPVETPTPVVSQPPPTQVEKPTPVVSQPPATPVEKPTPVVSQPPATPVETPTPVVSQPPAKPVEKPTPVVSQPPATPVEKPTPVVSQPPTDPVETPRPFVPPAVKKEPEPVAEEPKPFEPPPVRPQSPAPEVERPAARKPEPPAPVERPASRRPDPPPAEKPPAEPTRQPDPPARPAPVAEAPPRPVTPASRPAAAATGMEPGEIVWRYPQLLPGQGAVRPALRNCVAVADGKIYAALSGALTCLSDGEGLPQVEWQYPLKGHSPGSPVMAPDGRVRLHASDGMLHCVSVRGEQEFAPVDVDEPLGWASPVVDGSSNTFICSYHGGLLKVDASGAKESRPFFRSREKMDSTGLIRQGVFYVGAENAFVYAIGLEEKRPKNVWDHASNKGKTEWFINSSPAWGSDQTLVVAGRDEFLYGFDPYGETKWRLHIRGQMLASPIVDPDGNIYVGVSLLPRGEKPSGKLVCVDGASHTARWEFRSPAPIESTPVLGDDGMLYVGDNSGQIHCLNEKGGVKWSRQVGSPVRSAGSIVAPNRVVFGLDNGTLVSLYCSSQGLAEGGWPKYMGAATNCPG